VAVPTNANTVPLIINPLHDDKSMVEHYPFSEKIHHTHITKADLGVKESSIPACYFTLANTIMGAGTLGLPFALSNTGYVMGSVLLCLSAMSSSFALHLLSLCALKLPYPSSFYKVASTALPNFEKLIDLAVVIKCFGVATSYLIVIGGLMPDVMTDVYGSTEGHSKGFFSSRMTWVTAGFLIAIPLSSFQQLGALRYTSFMSLTFLFFLTLMVVLFACNIGLDPCATTDDGSSLSQISESTLVGNTATISVARSLSFGEGNIGSSGDDDQCVGERVNIQFNLNTMRVFSIFIFGFTCHQNMFTIVNELHAVTVQRCNRVILYAVGTAVSVYLVIANFGYSTYGSNVESNILVSYPSKLYYVVDYASLPTIFDCIIYYTEVPIVSVARCFVSLLVSFTYPLQCNPARRCVMTLLASIFKDEEKDPASLENVIFMRYIIVTVRRHF
jgi:amino acid permease